MISTSSPVERGPKLSASSSSSVRTSPNSLSRNEAASSFASIPPGMLSSRTDTSFASSLQCSSMAVASTCEWTMAWAASLAAYGVSTSTATVLADSGRGCSLKLASAITPSVPKEPVKSFERS